METRSIDIIPHLDEQVAIALARLNFHEFCDYMDPELFRSRPILSLATDAFQKVIDEYKEGRAIRVAIAMPPRFGKSITASLFAAYWLGNFPTSSFLRASATNRLYQKFSYDVRNIIRSGKYQKVFPLVKLSDDKQSLDGWSLTTARQVSYFGGGYGTSIVGFGASCACTDDMYPGINEALSEVYNENLEIWKQGSFNSRMEKNCPEIFISTRWSKNDLMGKAIEEGKIDILISIPALDENNQSTCEAVKTTAEYLKIKEETDETIFSAEYQQEPVEAKGLLFPKSSLKFFSRKNVDLSKSEYKFVYVDPADEGSDFNSAPGCILIGDKIFVPKELMLFNQDGTDINIPALVEIICNNKVDSCEVEGNSAWILFGKDLRNRVQERHSDCEMRIIKNTVNKQTRIVAQAAFIKNHFYFDEEFETDEQYTKFIKNLTGYLRDGKSVHDDAPDSLAGCAQYFINNFSHLW